MSNNITLEKAAKIIEYIYTSEIMGNELNSIDAFELGDFDKKDIQIIEMIASKYPQFKKLIEKFIKQSWTWERLAPLERAILLYGAFELNIKEKGHVINGMVMITKAYIPGDSYKFINAILEKIGGYYDEIKGH